MKNIKRFKEYSLITERLMDVQGDVDYIYDKYFKSKIDKIHETDTVEKDVFLLDSLTTDELTSPLSIKANKINHSTILINGTLGGRGMNYYNPMTSVLSIGISTEAVNYIVETHNGSLSSAVGSLKEEDYKNIQMEFSESRIKGTINHELAHWIDDTLHNKHIKTRAREATANKTDMTKGGLPINADKLEIQGQIHNILQLKRSYDGEWDELTFDEMVKMSPTLSTISKVHLEGSTKKKWVRDIKRRMHREGLLGGNMANT